MAALHVWEGNNQLAADPFLCICIDIFFIHHLWSVVDLWVLLSCCFFTLHEEQFLLYSTAIVLCLPLRLLSNGISVWCNLLRRHGPVGFLPSRWGHGLSVFMGLHDVALPTLAIGPAFLFPPFGNRANHRSHHQSAYARLWKGRSLSLSSHTWEMGGLYDCASTVQKPTKSSKYFTKCGKKVLLS